MKLSYRLHRLLKTNWDHQKPAIFALSGENVITNVVLISVAELLCFKLLLGKRVWEVTYRAFIVPSWNVFFAKKFSPKLYRHTSNAPIKKIIEFHNAIGKFRRARVKDLYPKW